MNIGQAIQMAVNYANEGQLDQAEKILQDIIAANDSFHPAYHLLGQLAFQRRQNDMAVKYFHQATVLGGNVAEYHRDLGEVFFYQKKPKEALAAVNRAIQINSNDSKSHLVAGNALINIGAWDQAIKAFEKAINLGSNNDFAHNNLGSLYEIYNRLKDAKHQFELAIKLNKGNVIAKNNLAKMLIAEGEIETAKELLNEAIKIKPEYITAHNNLSVLKKYKEGDEHIDILKSLLNDVEKMPADSRIRLHFNLGKVYADLEDYDKAFFHYQSSNKLSRATYKYDDADLWETAEKIKTTFSKNNVERPELSENNKPSPIFVVGMPRSGSSLIEQILSSHSMVHAGGELPTLGELVHERIGSFPDDVKNVSDDELKDIGNGYLKRIGGLNPEAQFIVDKMPGNYKYAGLITKIFPEAFIVNTNRNPLDCCVSNYTQLFLQAVPYANDLGELGRYFNIYSGLMDHWRSILPDSVLFDISYENVVADLEGEARKLIDFVGLEWEEECISFYKNKGTVRTASAAQVRKPIYKSSVEKWRVYEKHLDPLFDALGLSKLDNN